ncbi:MAG: PHP domain-containing protein [Quinella sp. 3Q1]|nr:PHP domain-containing protein [Quinella sp. 3Q1]MBR3050766.1 PHP domain-containing protein [Selenomonadaceae bacterium]
MAGDLHTHTNFSDGSYSPEELVAAAKKIGLHYLAITDHDTIDGVRQLYENGLYPDRIVNIIPGVELSANHPERDIHIVGYNIDIYNEALLEMIDKIIEARWERFSEIINILQTKKFNIREADVLKIAGTSRSIGRAHIARTLVKIGAFRNVREAFEKMLGKGSPAYVPRYLPEVDEVIDVIHQAGGVATLAHPKLVGDDDLVEELCKKLDGLEVYYPFHKPDETQHYFFLAKKYNLLITGGSDFHGAASRFVNELGDFTINDSLAEKFFVKPPN